MASVFLSYDRDDVPKAKGIALALETAGHSVWWDRHIKGGAQYSKEIEAALSSADAVVVLWSESSVDSAWVRDEATAGRDSNRLVPVLLDATQPPLGFRQYQSIDLSRWKRGSRGSAIRELIATIDAQSAGDAPAPTKVWTGPRHGWSRRLAITLAAFAFAGAALALYLWTPWSPRPLAPVVAVRPADTSAAARHLARDLLVHLGNVQNSRGEAARLVGDDAQTNPDLIIEVAGTVGPTRRTADLVLFRGRDRQILSSQAFAAEGGKDGDLEQSLAMAATRLLGCAADALWPRATKLREADLKPYLGACTQFALTYGSDNVAILLPQFKQVVRYQPSFAPAWKQLLLAEASLLVIPTDQPKPSPQELRGHIAAARKVDTAMPEAGIAQLELLPITDFGGRIQLVDRLAGQHPESPVVLVARSDQLSRVGRLNQAVGDAERAAMLDPTAPFAHNNYIRLLAYSGRIPRAFEEFDNAAPLALGASNLIEARFRLNMRYGDPHIALQLLRSRGTSKQHEAFLLARIDQTLATVDNAIAVSRAVSADNGYFGSHAEVLAAFDRLDELHALLMRLPGDRFDAVLASTLFRPNLKAFRQDPRFLKVAQRFGLLAYWRQSGKWPDYCFEPDLAYDCKVEAANIGAKPR